MIKSIALVGSKGSLNEDLKLMRLIDEQYLKTPYYGRRRMAQWLEGDRSPKSSPQTSP